MDDDTFPLLQLPQEIQNRIFLEHYKCAELFLRWNTDHGLVLGSNHAFDPLPSLNIELVCHEIRAAARSIRDSTWPRILTVVPPTNENHELLHLNLVFSFLVENAPRHLWLCNRIEEVVCLEVVPKYHSYQSGHNWLQLLQAMHRLHSFKFTTSYSLPIHKKASKRGVLVSLEAGNYDDMIIGNIYRLGVGDLPEQLQSRHGSSWAVSALMTFHFTVGDRKNWSCWYRRVIDFDFRTMAATSKRTIIDNDEMMRDQTESEGDEVDLT